ncbi:MAG: agmatine deiminase family protein [Bacteroidota bacterium]
MITDQKTNKLYLSDKLSKTYPGFYSNFVKALDAANIYPEVLVGTKDIWARDYMPVQVNENDYVGFKYDPTYLRFEKYKNKKTDGLAVFPLKQIKPERTEIILDGGNVIAGNDWAILTARIFSENPDIAPESMIEIICKLLQVKRIIIIPVAPYDFTGHADGAVRFYKEDTVLINDYSKTENKKYREYDLHLRMALHNAGLKYLTVPCLPDINKNNTSAYGFYINYLRIGNTILLPTFENDVEDDYAVARFKELFGNLVFPVKSNEIAAQGGVLNCISWTCKQ